MLVEQAIGKLLTSNLAVVTLVGTRIFSPKAPHTSNDNDWPILVYRTVPPVLRDPIFDPSGYSGLVRTRFRIFSSMKSSSGYAVAKRLNNAVRKALLGFQGTVVDDTVSPFEQVEIQGIFAHSTFDVDDYDDRTDTLSVFSDYDVWHDE